MTATSFPLIPLIFASVSQQPKLDKDSLHRRPEFAEQKPDPSLIKPTAGPSSIDRNGNQNHNHNPVHHHASTSNDRPTKLEPVTPQQPGSNTTIGNNRPVQPNTTTNTTWGTKNAPQQNNSRPTPVAGNTTTNVYRPPPKKQPSNAPVTVPPPQQQPQQPVAKPDTAEPATTSMEVDYMAGEDDLAFFGSEDEKWLMGDFDLDVDMGRPINFDGEEPAADQDDSGFQDAKSSGNADPRKATPSVPGSIVSTPAQRAVAVSVPGRNNNTNNAGLGSSTSGDSSSAQRSGGFDLVDPPSKGAVNPSRPTNQNGDHGNGSKGVNPQPLPNVRSGGNGTSIGNGNNRGQPVNGSTGNGNGGRTNLSNSTSTVQPSGSGNNRPSAGGFTFSPGVVRTVFPCSLHVHKG